MSDSISTRRFEPVAAAVWDVLRAHTNGPAEAIGALHLVIIGIMNSLERTAPQEVQPLQRWYRQLVQSYLPYVADAQGGFFRVSEDGTTLRAERIVAPDQQKAEAAIKKTVSTLLNGIAAADDGAFDLGDDP